MIFQKIPKGERIVILPGQQAQTLLLPYRSDLSFDSFFFGIGLSMSIEKSS